MRSVRSINVCVYPGNDVQLGGKIKKNSGRLKKSGEVGMPKRESGTGLVISKQ